MFTCKREHVEEWTSKHFPGDQFVSFMISSIYSAGYNGPDGMMASSSPQAGTQRIGQLVEHLGLNRDLVVGRGLHLID